MDSPNTPQDGLEHYRVLGEAGRGGMSLVLEAMDTRIERRVAIKHLVLPPNRSRYELDAMASRMEREARAIARLSHPNIVAIFDVGKSGGVPYLVMEFLEGRTLRARMQQGRVSRGEAARILDQAAAAIDAVHAAGIVHRDIKPSNLMLLPDGTVKLLDFGVARQTDDTLVTQAGTMIGSPTYMAPEQIEDAPLGPSCDVWALGVLLYEMLAGHPPFSGDRIAAVLRQITTAVPPPLSQQPPAVQAVVRRALAKNPAQRYASAGALARAYRDALFAPEPSVTLAASASLRNSSGRFRSWPNPAWLTPASFQAKTPLLRLAVLVVVLLLLGLLTLPLLRHKSSSPAPTSSRSAPFSSPLTAA